MTNVTLTTEQAQQIEEAFDKARIGLRDWELPENRYAALNAINPALATIRAARVQEQEPVAVISESAIGLVKLHSNGVSLPFDTPLYTHPVRTKDLTDDEIKAIALPMIPDEECSSEDQANFLAIEVIRAVIAADREKNK